MELRHKPQERDTIYKKLLWQIESNQRSSKNKYLDFNLFHVNNYQTFIKPTLKNTNIFCKHI